MRLSDFEIQHIINTVLAFDTQAKVILFGSRVDDTARGGDIDLLVISKQITLADELKLKIQLYDGLGEQKIDLIIRKDADSAFAQHAITTGVELCQKNN